MTDSIPTQTRATEIDVSSDLEIQDLRSKILKLSDENQALLEEIPRLKDKVNKNYQQIDELRDSIEKRTEKLREKLSRTANREALAETIKDAEKKIESLRKKLRKEEDRLQEAKHKDVGLIKGPSPCKLCGKLSESMKYVTTYNDYQRKNTRKWYWICQECFE